jgi:peptide subunit release factor RF-3
LFGETNIFAAVHLGRIQLDWRLEIEMLDERVNELRKQLQRKEEPIAIGKALAGIYLDNIATIRAYSNQLVRVIDY